MAATKTSMLPLTTIFTPPITCLQSTRTSNGSLFLGPTETSNCMPPGWKPNSWYSPGLCPSGYGIATRIPYSHGDLTESQGVCCPSGFEVPYPPQKTVAACTSFIAGDDVLSIQTISANPVSIKWHEYIDPSASLSVKEPKATARLAPVFVWVSLLVFLTLVTSVVIKFIFPKLHNASKAEESLLAESSSDEDAHREKESLRHGSITRDSWFYEIVAFALSILCLSGIIMVLWSYDKQITPEFSYGVTLNTAIALLSAATKALLVFIVGECIGQLRWIKLKDSSNPISQIQDYDNASRGPWGAVYIIGQDKGRTLVTTGALITILVLVLEPFVQQVLTYPVGDTVIETSEARTRQSRSVNYAAVDFDALTATANGAIWTSPPGLDVVCPTGNCTWPLFQSIELCSRCEDITSKSTLVGCNPVLPNINTTEMYQLISCNVSIPHGNWSSTPVGLFSATSTGGASQNPYTAIWDSDSGLELMIPTSLTWNIQQSSDFPPPASVLSQESFLGSTNPLYVLANAQLGLPSDLDGPRASSNSTPTEGLYIKNVTQCAMAFCLRTYEVSMSYGKLLTSVKKEDFGTFYETTMSDQRKDRKIGCWKANGSMKEPMDTKTEAQNISPGASGWTNSSGFSFCLDSPFAYGLIPALIGEEHTWYYGKPSGSNSWEWTPSRGTSGNNMMSYWVSQIGLDTAMQRIASSMSKFVRDNSDWTVSGRMTVSKSFVEVRWLWLIFPVTLVLLTMFLLGSTILVANTKQVSLWKNSLLPLLFNGPRDGLSTVNESSSLSEMDELAKTINLKLEDSSTRPRQVLRRQSS